MRPWCGSIVRCAHLYAQLTLSALAASPAGTALSVALVTTSVLCVVGAERAFARLTAVVARLAAGGPSYTASVAIGRCAECPDMLRASPLLQQLVQRSAVAAAVVHRVGTVATGRRRVPVLCVPAEVVPPRVAWQSPQDRERWAYVPGTPGVLVGADLIPVARRPGPDRRIVTAHGLWTIAGVLHPRPTLSAHAMENGVIMVPWRAPFTTLCNRAYPQWRITGADSGALHRQQDLVTGELRTLQRLRPGSTPPWAMSTPDRFSALVGALVERFRLWVQLVPSAMALLCGAGLFGVQTLAAAGRRHEFGVRRAVGATRSQLIAPLLLEAMTMCIAGIVIGCSLLALGGLLDTRSPEVWSALLRAASVAIPVCAAGLVLPGIAVARSASIAAVEGNDGT